MSVKPKLSAIDTKIDGIPVVPITLSDGQEWGLAMVDYYLRPKLVPSKELDGEPTVDVEGVWCFPLRTDVYLEPLREAYRVDPGNVPLKVIFRAGAALLMQAHAITLEQALGLLDVSGDGFGPLTDSIFECFVISRDDDQAADEVPAAVEMAVLE